MYGWGCLCACTHVCFYLRIWLSRNMKELFFLRNASWGITDGVGDTEQKMATGNNPGKLCGFDNARDSFCLQFLQPFPPQVAVKHNRCGSEDPLLFIWDVSAAFSPSALLGADCALASLSSSWLRGPECFSPEGFLSQHTSFGVFVVPGTVTQANTTHPPTHPPTLSSLCTDARISVCVVAQKPSLAYGGLGPGGFGCDCRLGLWRDL